MDTTQIEVCSNCSKPLPTNGFFCGGCLTQFKCRSCGYFLGKDNAGCTNCGTPRENRGNIVNANGNHNSNTFRLYETLTDRTIEATFSDNVGKDLTGMLRDTYSLKLTGTSPRSNRIQQQVKDDGIQNPESDEEIQETELLKSESAQKNVNQGEASSFSNQQNEYPTLKAVAMKNLPSTEVEWVVVYAFYASKFGKETFTRQNIIEKYTDSNRLDNDKKRDLSSNIKSTVRSGYINPLQSDFSILDEGIKKAKEIISRTSSASPKVPRSNSKQDKDKIELEDEKQGNKVTAASSGTSKSLKRLADINFYPPGKESLEDFYKKFTIKSNFERNLLFVYYLQEILKITGITFNHIYTCYDTLELLISENLPQTVRNTKSKTGWIETEEKSNIKVTVKGANQIKSWLKKL